MDFEGKEIALTGGTGFLGKAMTTMLYGAGANIHMLVRDDELPHLDYIGYVRGDVRNYDDVERLIYESDPDVVIHLAAVAPVGYAYSAPRQAITTNVLGTLNVAECCRIHGNIPLLVSSSDKAYGHSITQPVTERTPLNPQHPYDGSKAAADLILQSYAYGYGSDIQVTRCANLYGPGDVHWNRLIPGYIKAVLMKEKFQIRSDGTPVRDYLYVEEAAHAHLLLVNLMVQNIVLGFQAWNISAHCPRNVLDVIRSINRVMGREAEIEILGEAKEEANKLMVNGEKFHREFKWKPGVNLETGLEKTAGWLGHYLMIEDGR